MRTTAGRAGGVCMINAAVDHLDGVVEGLQSYGVTILGHADPAVRFARP